MFDDIKKIIFGGFNDKTNNRTTNNKTNNNNKIKNLDIFNRNRTNRRMLNYNLVSFEQARIMIETNQVGLIDVRTKSEYDIMHIKGAENIPVDEIERRIFSKEQIASLMIYCSNGSRSKEAMKILNNLGYNNIYIWEYAALATFPYKDMFIYTNNE